MCVLSLHMHGIGFEVYWCWTHSFFLTLLRDACPLNIFSHQHGMTTYHALVAKKNKHLPILDFSLICRHILTAPPGFPGCFSVQGCAAVVQVLLRKWVISSSYRNTAAGCHSKEVLSEHHYEEITGNLVKSQTCWDTPHSLLHADSD